MIEIKRMYHSKTGEIVFEDVNDDWWQLEHNFTDISVGNQGSWEPVVATKIDRPLEDKE